jgi:hypothetical protein
MEIKDLQLRSDERGAIIGASGTGKSYLAKRLLPSHGKLAIIDSKRQFSFDAVVLETAKAVKWNKPDRFIFRPKPDLFGNLNELNEVYKYCYEKHPFYIYTDDVIGIMQNMRYPHYFAVDYQMGRAIKVSCLSSFQRPARVPIFMMSESTKYYCFRLNLLDDIKRVREFVPGYDPTTFSNDHEFYFYDVRSGKSTAKKYIIK